MAECEVPDKLTMYSYLTQIYEAFRGEIPHIKHPKLVVNFGLSILKSAFFEFGYGMLMELYVF